MYLVVVCFSFDIQLLAQRKHPVNVELGIKVPSVHYLMDFDRFLAEYLENPYIANQFKHFGI